jgi:hypothetical protein
MHDYYELVQKNLQREQNNIILLATYNDHNAIYRSTEYAFYFSLLLLFFSSKTRSISGHENPPNKCAKTTRQNDPPEKSAMTTFQIHMRLKPAEFTRRKNPPFQLAACLPEIPPSLLRIPRQDPARHPFPPPPAPAALSTEQGGGGREPARPTHASRTSTLAFIPFFMNGYIFLYDTTYTYSIQSGLI